MRSSHIDPSPPAATLSDGRLLVPLVAVTAMTTSETYHVPRIPGSALRLPLLTHDDAFVLEGLLVGPERFAQRAALRALAEGAMLETTSALEHRGLMLVTDVDIRTHLFVERLAFRTHANRPGVLQVSAALRHVPRPRSLDPLVGESIVSVRALTALF